MAEFVNIEKAGEFGASRMMNLGYNCMLLNAMRDILGNDRDIMESKIVNKTNTIAFNNYAMYVKVLENNWDVFVNERFWGRISFGIR